MVGRVRGRRAAGQRGRRRVGRAEGVVRPPQAQPRRPVAAGRGGRAGRHRRRLARRLLHSHRCRTGCARWPGRAGSPSGQSFRGGAPPGGGGRRARSCPAPQTPSAGPGQPTRPHPRPLPLVLPVRHRARPMRPHPHPRPRPLTRLAGSCQGAPPGGGGRRGLALAPDPSLFLAAHRHRAHALASPFL